MIGRLAKTQRAMTLRMDLPRAIYRYSCGHVLMAGEWAWAVWPTRIVHGYSECGRCANPEPRVA